MSFFKKGTFKKKSVFGYFLVSYIAVFLIPVIISAFMITGTMDLSKKETVEKNLVISEQFKYSAEQILIRIENIRTKINSDRYISSLNYVSEDISSYERYNLLNDISRISEYILTDQDIVDSLYLYRSDKSVALGTNGLYSFDRLYHTLFSQSDLPYNNVSDILRMDDCRYIPYKETNVDGISKEYILCVLPVEKDIYSSNWSHVLMTVSKDRFAGKIKTPVSQADIFIINKDNSVISLHGNGMALPLMYEELKNSKNSYTKRINSKKCMVTYLSSDLTDWKYVMVEPVSSYLGRFVYIRTIIIIGFVLAFLIGLYIILRFSRKNYGDIKKIADLFGKSDSIKNELEFISINVEKSKEEIDKLKRSADTREKDLILTSLLRGDDVKLPEFFKTESARVVILNVENARSIYFDSNDSLIKKEEDAFFIIENTFLETFNSLVVSIDGIVAGIINDDTSTNIIKEKLNSLLEFYRKNFNLLVTASVGPYLKGKNSASKSYECAVMALSYKFLYGKGVVIDYNDTVKAKGNFNYSISTEQTLINCAKTGAFDEIKEIIDKIFYDNFFNNTIPVEMEKCLVFDISGTILRIIPKDSSGEYLIDTDFISNLYSMDSLYDIKENILEIFGKICEFNSLNNDNTNKFAEKVKEYIESNYSDPDINVSSLAQYFNMSGSYISKLFKSKTGYSILDFIHLTRITHAKELLKNGVSVSEVADSVGYNNSNAFIRVFKKYEKITPGQFGNIM